LPDKSEISYTRPFDEVIFMSALYQLGTEATRKFPHWETSDGRVLLVCADCLDVLPTLKAGSVDAVVTDPPYGISHPCNFAARGRDNLAGCNDYSDVIGDDEPFDPAPFIDMNLPTVLWGGNFFADKLPPTSGWLVWDKKRPDGLDQATCELAWTNCVKGVRRFSHLWNGMMRASEHGENYHPTQKPTALYGWVLSLKWLAKFDSIFDPFMGSGPCGVACVRLGRKFLGVEKVPKYFEIAKRRIIAELERMPLFEEKPKYRQAELIADLATGRVPSHPNGVPPKGREPKKRKDRR
jgi:DNA modification methylase